MKRIVVASDSFKGTLSSIDICHLFEEAFKSNKDYSLNLLPLADGGEGSIESIASSKNGYFINVEVNDLYSNKIKTHFYIDEKNNTYIEAASVVGFNLAKKDNDLGLVTTFGIGEQIKIAINLGLKNIYIFIGGTASNDGGVGLAAALGTKFYNKDGESFVPVGLTLKDIVRIDNEETRKLVDGVNIIVLSDVKSPFFGLEGAAYKFAPQKGASKEEVELLDEGLRNLSIIINKDLCVDISLTPGAGAAGGIGGGLIAFTNASISSGIDAVLDLIDFDKAINDADVVISGEGRIDRQTFDGKVIDGVAKRCETFNKELRLIVGISEISLDDIKKHYPCVSYIYETNDKHLPFNEIKDKAKEDYLNIIKVAFDLK